ncbi:MAG: glycosyltransferase family 2 protein, partial [Halobacteriota archaeon]
MDNPCVSVIILNWNRLEDLKECLESVLNQTFRNVELIVVDNHSSDGSEKMVRDEFPTVNLISLPDSSYGACEAFNIGFANAVGQFCLVLDNDILLDRDWITLALSEFKTDPHLGCLAGRVINYYTGRDWGFWNYGLDDTWQQREFFTSNFTGCSAIIRKDVLDKIGGYPKEYFLYWNELALGAEIVNAGFKIKYVPS